MKLFRTLYFLLASMSGSAAVAFAALAFAVQPVRGAVTEAWVHRYTAPGGDSVDKPFRLLRDQAGDYLVVGITEDNFEVDGLLIIKYAGADGSVLWQRRYPWGFRLPLNFPPGAALDGSGNLVLTGVSYTAKYAAGDGTVLWEKRGVGGYAVAVDSSGNVVVAGSSDGAGPGNNYDYYTAKYAAADGALLWEKGYDGPAHGGDIATAVVVDASGDVVVTGESKNGIDDEQSLYDTDYYTAKYAAADGILLWEKRYDGPWRDDDFPTALTVDGNGNVVVTGSSNLESYTARYAASNGTLLWEKRHGGAESYPAALALDASGDVVVTGYAAGPDTSYDYYTAKYAAATGALLWERHHNSATDIDDAPAAIGVDASGNVLVTGNSDGKCYTAKYAAANGALLWERSLSPGLLSTFEALAVAAGGNVVVTGYIYEDSASDFYTVKYASNGTLLWEKRYNGTGNYSDSASAVAVDARGNVVVTGTSWGTLDSDYYTAAYAGADGALLWERRYNGPANGPEAVLGRHNLAVGLNGMVAVTGASDGFFANGAYAYDYATVVYRELPPPNSFAAWIACFDLSGIAAFADADPDRDGQMNAVEYIFGGNPAVPDTSGSPAAILTGGNMVFTFSRDDLSETPDVTPTVESGPDLVTWPAVFTIGPNTAASSPGVSITENGTAPDTITVSIPQGTASRLFARLKVTITP